MVRIKEDRSPLFRMDAQQQLPSESVVLDESLHSGALLLFEEELLTPLLTFQRVESHHLVVLQTQVFEISLHD